MQIFILWLQPIFFCSLFNKTWKIDALPAAVDPERDPYLVAGKQKGVYKLGLCFRTCSKPRPILFSNLSVLWLFSLHKKKFLEIKRYRETWQGVSPVLFYLKSNIQVMLHYYPCCFWPSGRKHKLPKGLIAHLCEDRRWVVPAACRPIHAATSIPQLQELMEGRGPWLLFTVLLGHQRTEDVALWWNLFSTSQGSIPSALCMNPPPENIMRP